MDKYYFHEEPRASLTPRRIVHYLHLHSNYPFRRAPQPENNKAKDLSRKAKKRIMDCCNWLVMAAEWKTIYSKRDNKHFRFKINFITLTLPAKQRHSDNDIHRKIFGEFIKTWKRRERNLLYIYKAETQANGNLHYHLSTNSYIHYKELRDLWNRHCESLGYVSDFERVNGHRDPNSTDVHATKNIKNWAAYMAKYLCKSEEDRRLPDLKIWDCSLPLKQVRIPTIPCEDPYRSEFKTLAAWSDCRWVEVGNKRVLIQTFNPSQLKRVPNIKKLYDDATQDIRRMCKLVNSGYLFSS